MKLLPTLIALSAILLVAAPASASAKRRSQQAPKNAAPRAVDSEQPSDPRQSTPNADKGVLEQASSLDFDFFAEQPGREAGASSGTDLSQPDIAEKSRARRWMLKTHQALGIATWLSMVATVTLGQLNYNELWGGGGGSNKWQTPHRALVASTSTLFAATATFAILAPTPHKKPLKFDTGLIHRIAVIGATLGMVTSGVLGWITTQQAEAGNPHNLREMARAHQIVGYTTLGFLTVAGAVWVF